jgi:hypothetical protein
MTVQLMGDTHMDPVTKHLKSTQVFAWGILVPNWGREDLEMFHNVVDQIDTFDQYGGNYVHLDRHDIDNAASYIQYFGPEAALRKYQDV